VHFSDDPVEDEIAQRRLLHAAFKAGFEQVYLEYEPVAAARFYEQRLRNKKRPCSCSTLAAARSILP